MVRKSLQPSILRWSPEAPPPPFPRLFSTSCWTMAGPSSSPSPPPEILHPSTVPLSTLDPERTRKFFPSFAAAAQAFTQHNLEQNLEPPPHSHLTSTGSSNLRPSASCSLRSQELVVLARAILMHSDPVQIPVQIPPKGPWVSCLQNKNKIKKTAGRLSCPHEKREGLTRLNFCAAPSASSCGF